MQLGWILDRCLGRFLMCFLKRGAQLGDAKIIASYWYLQCLVAIDPLTKKQNKYKIVIKMGGVLREGCRHHFFIDFSSILTSTLAQFSHIFWHVWLGNLKQIFDIDFWRDFDGTWSKKKSEWAGAGGRGGGCWAVKDSQRLPIWHAQHLPKAGAADCKASPLPPAPGGKIGPCGKIGPLQLGK